MTVVRHATKSLPVVLKPVEDELLSSWIARHGEYYSVGPLAMLRHCLPDANSLRARTCVSAASRQLESRISSIRRLPKFGACLTPIFRKMRRNCWRPRRSRLAPRALKSMSDETLVPQGCVVRLKVGGSLVASADRH